MANEGMHRLGTPLLQRMEIRRLAIFRALQLGDMLCAVPALRALRTALPHAHITLVGLPWAAQFASRFDHYIDDFIAFPGHPEFPEQAVQEAQITPFQEAMRARHFDLAIQLHGSGEISNGIVRNFGATANAGFVAGQVAEAGQDCFLPYPGTGPEPLRLLSLVEFLGAPAAGTYLEFPVTPEDLQELADSGFRRDLAPRSYACIHPGARMRDKCWPPQRFAQVADELADTYGLKIVLTGSAKEADLTQAVAAHMRNEAVDAASPISIGAMAALMRDARLLVCNDTGVSHIAAGFRLPSVVIFSKADMERWSPLDRNLHRGIWDPEGLQVDAVLEHAHALLGSA